jgi:hypothetical protein
MTPSPQGEEIFPMGDNRYVTEESRIESSLDSEMKVIISSASGISGKLYVAAEKDSMAVMEYKKVLKALDPSEAANYAEVIDVVFDKTVRGLQILLQAPNPAPWLGTENSGAIEGVLYLPESCYVEIEAKYLDFVMEGPFRIVENINSFGRLAVQGVTERLNLSSSNRDISLEEIRGDISVTTSNADIRINGVESTTKPLRIRNENGNIYVEDLSGEFDIASSFGKIKLSEVAVTRGRGSLSCVHCPVNIEINRLDSAELLISNAYEDVELELPETIAARFFLSTELDGEIHVEKIPVRPIQAAGDFLELISGKGGSEIRIDIEGGGHIEIRGFSLAVR